MIELNSKTALEIISMRLSAHDPLQPIFAEACKMVNMGYDDACFYCSKDESKHWWGVTREDLEVSELPK